MDNTKFDPQKVMGNAQITKNDAKNTYEMQIMYEGRQYTIGTSANGLTEAKAKEAMAKVLPQLLGLAVAYKMGEGGKTTKIEVSGDKIVRTKQDSTTKTYNATAESLILRKIDKNTNPDEPTIKNLNQKYGGQPAGVGLSPEALKGIEQKREFYGKIFNIFLEKKDVVPKASTVPVGQSSINKLDNIAKLEKIKEAAQQFNIPTQEELKNKFQRFQEIPPFLENVKDMQKIKLQDLKKQQPLNHTEIQKVGQGITKFHELENLYKQRESDLQKFAEREAQIPKGPDAGPDAYEEKEKFIKDLDQYKAEFDKKISDKRKEFGIEGKPFYSEQFKLQTHWSNLSINLNPETYAKNLFTKLEKLKKTIEETSIDANATLDDQTDKMNKIREEVKDLVGNEMLFLLRMDRGDDPIVSYAHFLADGIFGMGYIDQNSKNIWGQNPWRPTPFL